MLRRLLFAQRGGFSARTHTPGLRRRNISTSIFGYTISGTPKPAQQTRQAGGGRDGFFNGAGEGFGLGLAILLSVHIFYDHGYSWTGTWGPSMLPTLNASGTSVVVSKWYRRGRGIQVGDIVSYKHPINGDMTTIKRVIGMPGDFVLRDTPGKGDGTMIQVPVGHCWTVGDNLAASRDSRMYGPVPLALVRGKVVAIWNNWLEMPQSVHNAFREYNTTEDAENAAAISEGG